MCENPATVHLTQIVGNKIEKLDLCKECAMAKGVMDPDGFSLSDVLKGHIQTPADEFETEATPGKVSEVSGTTFDDFKQTGRMGSADCYDLFHEELMPILKTMHKGTRHLGKVPTKVPAEPLQYHKRDKMRQALDLAIKEERYEDAARLRDELKEFEQTLQDKQA